MPQQQQSAPSFLALLTGLCVFLFAVFLIAGSPGAGVMSAVFVWFALALPYAMLRALVNLSRKPRPGIRRTEPIAVKSPSRAGRLAEMREEYEHTLVDLLRAGLNKNELRAARRKAKQVYLRKIDSLMGG